MADIPLGYSAGAGPGSEHRKLGFSRHQPTGSSQQISAQQQAWSAALAQLRPLVAEDAGARIRLQVLSKETDPTLFWNGLLNLAQQAQFQDNLNLAVPVYELLAQTQEAGIPAAVSKQAGKQLGAIRGTGAAGDRFEFLAGGFAKGATDPAMIFAFGSAGLAYKFIRFKTLAGLMKLPAGGLTRGIAANTIASLTGFAAEATWFPVAGKLGNQALGRKVDWSFKALKHDVAASFLVLGGLKFMGGLSRMGVQQLSAPGMFSSKLVKVSQATLPQAGMLTGLMLGHKAEEWTGLRQPLDGATTLTDSLMSLFQLNTAGSLLRGTLPQLQGWEHRLDAKYRYQNESNPPPSPQIFPQSLVQLEPGFAEAGSRSLSETPWIRSNPMLMSGEVRNPTGGQGEPIVPWQKGALAVGNLSALRWLQGLRHVVEKNNAPSGYDSQPQLLWVPEHPLNTVLLNEFGVILSEGLRDLEVVNRPGQVPIRATVPLLEPGTTYLTKADVVDLIKRQLETWKNREKLGYTKILTWERLRQQLESLFKKKEEVESTQELAGKRVLKFKEGRQQTIPPSFILLPEAHRPATEITDAIRSFQNQYWKHAPKTMAEWLSDDLLRELPQDAMINYRMEWQAILLPTYTEVLHGRDDLRFFFFEENTYRVRNVQLENQTNEFAPDIFEFLKRAQEDWKPPKKKLTPKKVEIKEKPIKKPIKGWEENQPVIINNPGEEKSDGVPQPVTPEISISQRLDTGTAAFGTLKKPSASAPTPVSTQIKSEESGPRTTAAIGSLSQRPATDPNPQPEEPAVSKRESQPTLAWDSTPLPPREPSTGRKVGRGKRKLETDPTQPLSREELDDIREQGRLPFDDTPRSVAAYEPPQPQGSPEFSPELPEATAQTPNASLFTRLKNWLKRKP